MSKAFKVLTIPAFNRSAKKLMSEEEINEFKLYISSNPWAGDVMSGTGGVRKVRWAVGGRGKSGGVRIIYFLITKKTQIVLFDIYAKSDKENLTKAERNQMKKLTAAYKRSERSKR